ncbi:MAG: histidine kinase [Rhodobacteraceae bacterium]|nr:histidine kinase [Paracoccaceae bacterium]
MENADNAALAAIARLTEREKDCLRRWLSHATAKEIALELGISPHAVEKRLKMARTKLGVTSSRDAARLLAEAEGYDPTAPHTPDLAIDPPPGKQRRTRSLILGGIAVSLIVAALVIVASQTAQDMPQAAVPPRPGEIVTVVAQPFEAMDTDGSGYLEGREVPSVVRVSGSAEYKADAQGTTSLAGDAVAISPYPDRARFYAEADTDGDGRVSPAEYRAWAKPRAGGDSAIPG